MRTKRGPIPALTGPSGQPAGASDRVSRAKVLIPRDRSRIVLSSSRIRTSRACDPCRQRKAKCNGGKPTCVQCDGLALECTYSEQKRTLEQKELTLLRSTIRRHERMFQLISSRPANQNDETTDQLPTESAPVENNMEVVPGAPQSQEEEPPSAELQYPKSLDQALSVLQGQLRELHQIYQVIHDCDPAALPAVVDTIRRSSSVHDAAMHLDRQVSTQRPGVTLSRVQRAWLNRLSGKAELISRHPPYTVTAAEKWTTVVDSPVASHLFSLFFVWDNPTWHLIEPRVFLDDFQSGRTQFCSSLLVHAILFFACHYSYDLEKPWDRREEMSIAKRLFREIGRLWQRDKDKVCLTTVQASLILGLFFNATGKDKIGVQYIYYGGQMALQLGLHLSSSAVFHSDSVTEAQRNNWAHKFIACGIYDVQSITMQLSRKPSPWRAPPENFLSPEEALLSDVNQQWAPYPFTFPTFKPYPSTGICVRRNLLILINDISSFEAELPSRVDLPSWQKGTIIHGKLVTFERTLPMVLGIGRNKTPHNLCLHLYYHMAVVNLCGLFNSREATTAKDIIIAATQFNPQQVLEDAMDAMATIILLYRVCHGWKSIPVVMVHYFFVIGLHAASNLRSSKWREALVSCVSGLWHMGLAWRICRPFLRTIQLVLSNSADATLIPAEAQAILQEFNEKLWTQEEIQSLAANYVVHHHPTREGTPPGSSFQGESLENLIRAFDKLSTADDQVSVSVSAA
ncbi:uncharacterized protein BO97DRAFT_428037 [Aspergillus homomorphus CBS 101889]|uniref:Zn(2)-C6 fungal-type domain-containing protein n=1 Tax=Aspergillus homomorphus (strain CBS 101889) TaxID=1450537 RepID=A0A395HLB3_ASPHC|nr:hypothetical protein BO97DRAFT_428037 [Aspergillus homomorphus CBS 101889]RAL08722.1 hypothetical protein BO97DRAFT_428037 [Aspergillus homomorphus CBS 101889]